MEVFASCPYCGEEVGLWIDVSGGEHQSYVEDCSVCCNPWQVDVRGAFDEGTCEVTLARADE